MSLVAIIDIGSTSVGGALLTPNKTKGARSRWRVVYTTRQRINFNEQIESKEFFTQMLNSLKLVLKDFSGAAYSPVAKANHLPHHWWGNPVKEIHCFLSAPFYAGQTRIIRHTAAKPIKITDDLIKNLITSELKRFETEHADKHCLIENRLMSVKLNGYSIATPYGQMAQELELINYFSLGSIKVLDKIEAVLIGAFPHRRVRFHTMALTAYQVWEQIMPDKDSYLLFDIGGEVTELSIVSRGLLWETLSFPIGENYLVREVAKALKTSLPEAYSTIKRQIMAEHNQRTTDQLNQILKQLKDEWLAACLQTLNQTSSAFFLPDKVWLIGDPGLALLFGDWLDGESLNTLVLTKRRLAVDYWKADWFLSWCEYDVRARQDSSLMAESIYYDKIVSK